MPVDRRDLLEILELQDTVANTAQDIAGLLMERDMTVPKEMAEAAQRPCQTLCRYQRPCGKDHRRAG